MMKNKLIDALDGSRWTLNGAKLTPDAGGDPIDLKDAKASTIGVQGAASIVSAARAEYAPHTIHFSLTPENGALRNFVATVTTYSDLIHFARAKTSGPRSMRQRIADAAGTLGVKKTCCGG